VSDRRRLTLLPQRFAFCRFPADSPLPVWVLHGGATVWSMTRTPTEFSLVCPEDDLPPSVDEHVERSWRAFALEGPIPFDVTGVIASLSAPLAAAGVPLSVISTYDTDLLFVRERDVERACGVLGTVCEIVRS
jgi:uncharacterized protein